MVIKVRNKEISFQKNTIFSSLSLTEMNGRNEYSWICLRYSVQDKELSLVIEWAGCNYTGKIGILTMHLHKNVTHARWELQRRFDMIILFLSHWKNWIWKMNKSFSSCLLLLNQYHNKKDPLLNIVIYECIFWRNGKGLFVDKNISYLFFNTQLVTAFGP